MITQDRPGNLKGKNKSNSHMRFFPHYTSVPNFYSSPWLVQAMDSSISVSLKEFKECVNVALRTQFSGGSGSVKVMVRLNDPKGLLTLMIL